MIVSRSTFDEVLLELKTRTELSLDTETTGLRAYHGDRLFSLILAYGGPDADSASVRPHYFNFQAYAGVAPDLVLLPEHLERLRTELFSDPNKLWFIHNSKFDMSMLAAEGITLAGQVHCTKALALIEYNEHLDYSLEACSARIGLKKDDRVDKYIQENKLYEKRMGATQEYTHKFYDRVPFEIVSSYGAQDALLHYCLGRHQEKAIQRIADATPPSLPSLRGVLQNERRLTHTVFRMERLGVRIDRPYCVRAARFEADRADKAMAAFKQSSGRDFKNSPKLFATLFADERDLWDYTEEGNPSFKSPVLKRLKNPAAKAILEYRDAKSKRDFYQGFLYHADRDGIVHPNLSPDGAATGRFSSSNPNLQNITSEEDEEELNQEFVVRRVFIPREGKIFFMPDYEQMEYKLALELACQLKGEESKLARRVKGGEDFHQAVTDMVSSMAGREYKRKQVKNVNFAKIYGAGLNKLASMLECSIAEARQLVNFIDSVAPEIEHLCQSVASTAERRRFIFNWLGRRCYFPNPRFAYCAPNYLIQGGCADVVKVAMNQIDAYLLGKKSKLLLQIHDELLVEVDQEEMDEVPRKVQEIMIEAFPYKYLPLTSSAEWSERSMADKRKGLPCAP